MDGHDGGGHDHGHDAGMGGHHGHHDAYGNADHGHGGHSTFEALSVGFSHAGTGHGHFSNFGTLAHGHQCGSSPIGSGHSSHNHAGNQQQKKMDEDRCDVAPAPPTVNGERRLYVAHVVAHGKVNILDELARICKNHDVIRLDTFRPSMNGEDRLEFQLADDEPWVPPYDLKNQPPGGYYPNATGATRFVKQVWQVGRRPSIWDKGVAKSLRMMRKHEWVSDPQYDPNAKTFFDIGVVTWSYKETGDHDTLITIRIASQLVWQRYFGMYGYKKIPFQKHQQAAEKIIQELLDVLVKAVPTENQVRLRNFYAVTLPAIEAEKNQPAPKPDDSTPKPPASDCPAVPEGVVPGSGSDVVGVVASPEGESDKRALQKVDVVVTIPRK